MQRLANMIYEKELILRSILHIVKHCLKNQIGDVINGEYEDIKPEIYLGKKTNQNFVQIPYSKVVIFLGNFSGRGS